MMAQILFRFLPRQGKHKPLTVLSWTKDRPLRVHGQQAAAAKSLRRIRTRNARLLN